MDDKLELLPPCWGTVRIFAGYPGLQPPLVPFATLDKEATPPAAVGSRT